MDSENKILIALQFWKGDKLQAMRLADFLADLEPGRSEQADFLFVSRFDCPQDIGTVSRVSRKFNTFHTVSRRRGTGWPVGCNELWLGTMEWAVHMRAAKKIPRYKAIFTFEADVVPLARGWIGHLTHHWDLEYKRRNGQLAVMGAWLPNGFNNNPVGHINGNCMCSLDDKMGKDILKTVNRCPSAIGWDFFAGAEFQRLGWAKMPGQMCEWRTGKYTVEKFNELLAANTILHHGCKDNSLLDLSRKHLL
jgi:hypothetical protein